MEGTKLPSSTSYLAHCAFGHVFALLFGTGHLMPSEADESHEGIEVMLEQCRAQNRQLVSEMRKPMSLLCIPYLTNFMFLVCFAFSSLSGQAPPYLADSWFWKVLDVNSTRLWTDVQSRTHNTFCDRSFAAARPCVRNSLPVTLAWWRHYL